jgi:hypothetical protein
MAIYDIESIVSINQIPVFSNEPFTVSINGKIIGMMIRNDNCRYFTYSNKTRVFICENIVILSDTNFSDSDWDEITEHLIEWRKSIRITDYY